jgi:hypothetical protein
MRRAGWLGFGMMMVLSSIAGTATPQTAQAGERPVSTPAVVVVTSKAEAAEVTPAPIVVSEVVTPPSPIPYLENPKLRRLQKREVSARMLQESARIVRKYYAARVGTQVEVDVDGQRVVARLERHFHPQGGPVKPWGFHAGVSLFVYR